MRFPYEREQATMPRDPRIGTDATADKARQEGEEYEGLETPGAEQPHLPRKFREMVDADEDA